MKTGMAHRLIKVNRNYFSLFTKKHLKMNKYKRSSNATLPSFVRMLDNIFSEDFSNSNRDGLTVWNGSMPAVNVKETEDQFELELAAPGLNKEAFNIEVDADVLTISSEKKEENKEDEQGQEEGKYTRREFRYSAFKRTFNLPDTVDSNKIAANYADGILSIVIPKKEEAKPQPARKIDIV